VALHFGAELDTPKLAVFAPEAATSVRSSSLFDPIDAKFLRVDLDALGERKKVIASRSRHACACGPFGHTESASWQYI